MESSFAPLACEHQRNVLISFRASVTFGRFVAFESTDLNEFGGESLHANGTVIVPCIVLSVGEPCVASKSSRSDHVLLIERNNLLLTDLPLSFLTRFLTRVLCVGCSITNPILIFLQCVFHGRWCEKFRTRPQSPT